MAPLQTNSLSVHGTRYYQVAEAKRRGLLRVGTGIYLRHEPTNQYDANAVAVVIAAGNLKLGHISKDAAPRYVKLLREGVIKSAKITKIGIANDRFGVRPMIHIAVTYPRQDEIKTGKEIKYHGTSDSQLPDGPGVYHIICVKASRRYVGESENVRRRIKQHFQDLTMERHDNTPMQDDFRLYKRRAFTALYIGYHPDKAQRLKAEEQEIAKLLGQGARLYNLTSNGQGHHRLREERGRNDIPISDKVCNKPRSANVSTLVTAGAGNVDSPRPFQVTGRAIVVCVILALFLYIASHD